MITGDNPMTAAAIAAEAGVDDFLAQATPEDKLKLIRDEQCKGKTGGRCAATAPTMRPHSRSRLGGRHEHEEPQAARRPVTWSTSIPTRPS